MKNFAIILAILSFCPNLFGQESDILESLKSKFSFTEFDKLEHIMVFNKDTILVAGYLENSLKDNIHDVVYQTSNGGFSWEKYFFDGNAWIYNTHYERNGNVWMGGSDNYVHFSNDYGKNWKRKIAPFKPINRIFSIFMIDSLKGIAGGLSNGLAITLDNWKTSSQIPTPLDQKKYVITENSSRDRVEKVQFIDSIILINQNDHIYFSDSKKINWKEFNIPVTDFEIKKIDKTIKLFSLRDRVYILDPQLFLKDSIPSRPIVFSKDIIDNLRLNISSFLNSEINLIKIKTGRFVSDGIAGGHFRSQLYKEEIQNLKVKDKNKISIIKNILQANERFIHPRIGTFNFTQSDLDDYAIFYKKELEKRKEATSWGGDFTSQYRLDNKNFANPELVLGNLTQKMFESVYYHNMKYPWSFDSYEPYIKIELINENSESIKITSENAVLLGLPWTLEYNETKIYSYDNRITEFVKLIITPKSNYYNRLLGGELIYRLIEERIDEELEYKNGN